MNVDKESGRLLATLKTDSPSPATNIPILVNIIREALQPLC